jgi:hypothetical protein
MEAHSRRKCEICGSNFEVSICKEVNKYLCNKHKLQVQRYGGIKRTKFDPNEIIIHDNYAEVCLYNKFGEEIDRTKISLCDIDIVSEYKWHKNKWGYAEGVKGKTKDGTRIKIKMHRLLINCPENMEIDHINRDTLDNRRENLRICNRSENGCNTIRKNKTGFRGITKCHNNDGYFVRIYKDKKYYYYGYYKNIDDAIKARELAEKEHFGEFAPVEPINKNGGEFTE